eukprot:Awhi_evm1s2792
MTIRIRFQRWGSKKNPYYRLVASHNKGKRDGKNKEILGGFNPIVDRMRTKKSHLFISRIKYWIGVGGEIKPGAALLLHKAGLLPPYYKEVALQRMGLHVLEYERRYNDWMEKYGDIDKQNQLYLKKLREEAKEV